METRARASKSTNRASLESLVYAVWTMAVSFANLVKWNVPPRRQANVKILNRYARETAETTATRLVMQQPTVMPPVSAKRVTKSVDATTRVVAHKKSVPPFLRVTNVALVQRQRSE